jgi:hypothetical protein
LPLNAAKVQVRIPIFGSSSGSGITHSRLARSLLVGRNERRRGLPGSGRLRALTTDSQDTANNNNALLETPLPEHPDLYRGTLKSNGLHYVVLPNKVRIHIHSHTHIHSQR